MSSCRSYSSPSIGTMCFQCFYYPSWTNLSSKTIYNWLNDPPLLSEFIGAFHHMSSVALGSFPQHAIYAFSWFTNLIDTNICFWIVRNELKIENKLNLAKVKWFEKSQFGYQKNFQMIGWANLFFNLSCSFECASVTRLGYFWFFLVAQFRTKVAQLFG